MRQQIADRDGLAPIGIRAVIPFGNVARHGQVEADAACFHLHGDERRRHDGLGQRSGVVNRVHVDGRRFCVVRLPAEFVNDQFILVADRQHAAGKRVIGDGVIEHVIGAL